MTLKTSKLRDAVVFALVVGATTVAGTGLAMAQEQEQTGEDTATELDRITVTGTRIRSQSITAASPVAEIQAEEFQYSGATKVEDLVNQYPQMTLSFDNFENNGSQGYATVDLRGLGSQRTLTLVNGRRIPKGLGETPDISIIPASLVRRVDILTGGASAVYGSDAVAGVVNFLLNDQFEGVSLDFGYSAYQHDNDNQYIRGLMDEVGFEYPSGNSGFDGISRSIEAAVGGSFGEGGHAMAWATWRKNDPLLQGERDYSSCALNSAGTACGGSATADPGNFYIFAPSINPNSGFYALPDASGTWSEADPYIYNYAPINYYQRPDTRYTAGASVKYEINEHFRPYLETMFVNRKSPTQIAPSGAFFTDIAVNCDTSVIGTMCNDLGITDDEFTVYVAKRNVEGGPRISAVENTNYSITAGMDGAINDRWSYDSYFTYARTTVKNENYNDFITTRVQDALLGCPAGSFNGCVPYEVWTDSITAEQAQALQGIGIVNYTTSMKVINGYVSGDLGFGLPWANGEPISLVAGYEWRQETYERAPDTNMEIGNFTGLGGPTSAVSGEIEVDEFFLESSMPVITDVGALDRMGLELGYRYSDYSTSGGVQTYKVGTTFDFADSRYRLRAGWNRAIRAPNINELYEAGTIGLWPGVDPCAGPTPDYTAEQCARTGVLPSQYGNVAANPAGQYNQIEGGDLNLDPEEANTWTFGFAATPIDNLNLSIDYFDIRVEEAITSLGAENILRMCAVNGDPAMCGLIRRNASTGDLFRGSNPEVSGLVFNSLGNYGEFHFRGIDLTASYAWDLGPGRLSTSMVGTYLLEQEFAPIPGNDETTYDCAGLINASCFAPEWRHIANVRYAFDRYTVGLRWRYIGEMDYTLVDGSPGTTDFFLVNNGNKMDAVNYLDLSGSVELGDYVTWTAGVNNVLDKEPPMIGGSLLIDENSNANSITAYDQAGRYIFTSVRLRF